MQTDEDRPQMPHTRAVRWLLESYRNHALTASPPPAEFFEAVERSGASSPLRKLGRDISYHDVDTLYEPRVLAISPGLTAIAVGTKAGRLFLLEHSDGSEWSLVPDLDIDSPVKGGRRSRGRDGDLVATRAIRGLCFLDDDTLLLGRGVGEFVAIVRKGAGEPWNKRETQVSRKDIGAAQALRDRLRRLLPVHVDAKAARSGEARRAPDAALGFTGGDTVFFVRHGGGQRLRWVGRMLSLGDLIDRSQCGPAGRESGGDPDDASDPVEVRAPEWQRRRAERIADATCSGSSIWLLHEDGILDRCEMGTRQDGKDVLPVLIVRRTWLVGPPFEDDHFRRIVACDYGLAVLTANAVSFLRFDPDEVEQVVEGYGAPADGDPDNWEPEDVMTTWVDVRDATDCTVSNPFGASDDGGGPEVAADPDSHPPHRRRIPKDNPVWVAVGTAEPGVHWCPWHDVWTKTGFSSVESGLEDKAPARTANERPEDEVLLLAIGTSKHPDRNALLVSATRSHHAVVSTIMDRHEVFKSLVELVPPLIEERGEPVLEALSSPGFSYWLLMRRIEHDMESPRRPWAFIERVAPDCDGTASVQPGEWFQRAIGEVGAAEIRRMGTALTRGLRRRSVKLHAEGLDNLLIEHVRTWLLRILERAYELGTQVGREVAERAHRRLVALASDPETGLTDSEELFVFADFLQKWFVRGYTYGEKTTHIFRLMRDNHHGCRSLDTLTYLTTLLRRRVDLEWIVEPSRPSPAESVFDIACAPNTGVVVSSHLSGAIRVTDSDGMPMRWRVDPRVLEAAQLQIGEQGASLERLGSSEFVKRYRHGAYAHQLLFLDGSSRTRDVLVFALYGWREGDRVGLETSSRHETMLCALSISVEDGEAVIESASGLPTDSELRSLLAFPEVGTKKNEYRIVAGTTGTWKSGPDNWLRQPFVTATIVLKKKSIEFEHGFEATTVRPLFYERSVPTSTQTRPETVRNDCTSLASTTLRDGVRILWAGFQDGQIRCFAWNPGDETRTTPRAGRDDGSARPSWQEVPGLATSGKHEGGPRLVLDFRDLGIVSAVTQLEFFEDQGLLVFGTRGGMVAGYALRAGLRDKEADSISILPAEPPPQRGDDVVLSGSWPILFHTQLAAGVCGVQIFTDEAQDRLSVLTEDGVMSLFDVHPPPKLPAGGGKRAATGREVDERRRAGLLGQRVDRFHLRLPGRALRFTRPREGTEWLIGEPAPRFLVGDGEGRVRRFSLVFPQGSQRRRRDAVGLAESLKERAYASVRTTLNRGTTPHLEEIVGGRWMRAWLGVIDIGSDYLLRYALWADLREARVSLEEFMDRLDGEAWRHGVDDFVEGVDAFVTLMSVLVERAYRRSPFRREPAKIIWEEGSKLAHRLAISILSIEEELEDHRISRTLQEHYLKLVGDIDDFCNQWIGAELSEEARVLAHSFNSQFDWPAITILAGFGEVRRLDDIRRFIINKLVHRRLTYARDSMLPLETLRVTNAAIFRAILRQVRKASRAGKQVTVADDWPFILKLKPADLEFRASFYDLVILIGDLAERNGARLTAASALSTELHRFFGLCLLLVPTSAVVFGQIVSESRLMDRARNVEGSILAQAEMFKRHIAAMVTTGVPSALDEMWKKAMERFAAYARADVLDERGQEHVQVLRNILADDNVAPAGFTDKDIVSEYFRVHDAARQLKSLDGQLPAVGRDAGERLRLEVMDHGMLEDEDSKKRFALYWLEMWKRDGGFETTESQWKPRRLYRFFAHSCQMLGRLWDIRTDIWEHYNGTGKESVDPLDKCRDALNLVETESGLFEPQRTQYRRLVEFWRRSIELRGQRASQTLQELKSFNRHVYRSNADSQMAAVYELVRQHAPAWPEEGRDELIQWAEVDRRLENQPLLRRVYSTAKQMVDQTHLSGTLLAVAEREFNFRGAESDSTPFEDLQRILKQSADDHGIAHDADLGTDGVRPTEAMSAPGTPELWRVIADEVADNISKHGGDAVARMADRTARAGDPRQYRREELIGRLDRSDPKVVVLRLHGRAPLIECIDEEHRKQVGKSVTRLRKLAGEVIESARRLGSPAENSSGFGLSLIDGISKLSRMTMTTGLAEESLQSPLEVSFSWDAQ